MHCIRHARSAGKCTQAAYGEDAERKSRLNQLIKAHTLKVKFQAAVQSN
jgi:hypothetical protein